MDMDKLVREVDALASANKRSEASALAKENGYTIGELAPALRYYIDSGRTETIDYGTFDAVLQGASFGFSDEIAGLGSGIYNSIFTDLDFMTAYDQKVADFRQRRDVFAAVNPKTAMAAELGGALATGFLVPGGLLATSGRFANAMRVAPIRSAAAIGAVEGALAGAGGGEGLGGTLSGAGVGAIAGGGLGAAGSALVGGLARAVRPAANTAMRKTAEAFAADGVNLSDAQRRILANQRADADVGLQPQDMLVDYAPVGGQAARLLRGARGVATDRSGQLDDALNARARGDTIYGTNNQGRVGQAGRIDATLSKANVKAQTVDGLIEQLDDSANAGLSAGYKKAFADNQGIGDPGLFNSILKIPRIRKAYKAAREIYNAERRAGVAANEIVPIPPIDELMKDGVPTTVLPLEFLDLVKREAQDGIYGDLFVRKKITKKGSATDRKLVGEFTEELKAAVSGSEYKAVLAKAADKFALREAADIGDRIMRMSPSELKARVGKMSSQEKDAMRIGMLENIRDTLNTTKDSRNLIENLVGSPALRQKIDILFDGDEAGKAAFVDRIQREVIYQIQNNILRGSSQTADKLQDNALFDVARDFAVGVADPSVLAATVAGKTARNLPRLQGQKVAGSVIDTLSDQNPASQIQTLQNLQRFQRANQALGALRGGAGLASTLGGGAALTGGYSQPRRQR